MKPNGIEAQRARAIAERARRQSAPPRELATPEKPAEESDALNQLRAELEERDRRIKIMSAALVKNAREREKLRTALAAALELAIGEKWKETLKEVTSHGTYDADHPAGDRRAPARK